MDLLAGMEFDLFAPSFPELQQQFNLTPFWVEALLSVNFIGYFLSLFAVGSLADRYGRKPIIVLGLVIFILGSIMCLYSPSYAVLLIGRFFQGVGVAAPAILSFLIIADIYPLKQQQSLYAVLNGVMNAAVGIAPVLGSYISLYFHWQGNFVALLLLGVATLLMTIPFIPTAKAADHKEPFSLKEYLPIFKSKPLLLIMLHFVFAYTPYWIFVGMSPLLYMEELGVSLAYFGYYQGALALLFAVGTLLSTMLVNRFDQKKMLRISLCLEWGSLLSIAVITFSNSTNPLFITLSMLPYIVAGIIPNILLYPICLNFMPQAKGRVSAALRGTHLVCTAISLQLAGYVYSGSFKSIGLLMIVFVFLGALMLGWALKNAELMSFLEKKE